MSRILAIEPDPERGQTLKRLVGQWVNADVIVAASADDAIAAMTEQGPDLILTSALISPSDDQSLSEYLKQLPDHHQLPVLTVPPLVDPALSSSGGRRGLLSLFRRSRRDWPSYDQEALSSRIKEALEESVALGMRNRFAMPAPEPESVVADPSNGVSLILDDRIESLLRDLADARSESPEVSDEELLEHCGLGPKRLRAHRWTRTDLPWLAGVKLPWGLDVHLLNISTTGLLIESGARFMPGSSTVFRLWGPNKDLVVPARVVRSQVSTVDSFGVKYRAAASFERAVDELGSRQTSERPPHAGAGVTEVLARVKSEAARGAEPAGLRAVFEHGIRDLVTAREIRIRDVPVVKNDGSDSVYLSVPTASGAPTVLQATFEPHYQPRPEEIEVLKEAATCAADLLRIEASA